MSTGLHHAGVTVRDTEKALSFYRDVLELDVVSDALMTDPFVFEIAGLEAGAIRIVCLSTPGTPDVVIELLEYQGVERHAGSARPCDPGTGHLCLEVSEIERLHQKLVSAGYAPRSAAPVEIPSGDAAGAKVLYVGDPDGYVVELFQPRSH